MPTAISRTQHFRSRTKAKWVGLLMTTLTGLSIATKANAERVSGIQLTPDSGRYLISKDVGTDRWAITYNLNDKTVTGNVFSTAGSPPQFVWCVTDSVDQATDPTQAQYHLSCSFASTCSAAPCDPSQWTIGSPVAVTVPGSFLLPPSTQATLSGSVQPILSAHCANSPSCHANGQTPDLLPGRTWTDVFGVASTEAPDMRYVAAFDPDSSYLLAKVLGTASGGSRMPLGMTPLSDTDTATIRAWILEGAANN